ncbi:MAG TPA: NAD-binding protein [Terriglobia bacterium]|jgi:NAD(P) transhydrogenase|nr:NAD-binding protein [Terriglobia bacterium]
MPEYDYDMLVIGSGPAGHHAAIQAAKLGIRVTLMDMRPRLQPFVDGEIVDSLAYHLRNNRVTLWLSEKVTGIEPYENDHGGGVGIRLASGKVDYFVNAVFNYPTLAECYKNAASDGINRMRM